MNPRHWLAAGLACLASGAVGYRLGARRASLAPPVAIPPPEVALAAPAPPPVSVPAAGPAPAPATAAHPPNLPVVVPLTEPRGPLPGPGGDAGSGSLAAKRGADGPRPPPADPMLEVLRAEREAQDQRLEEMSAQIQELREQLTSTQERTAARQADLEQRTQELTEALGALRGAEAMLAQGSADVEENLAQASAGLPPPARTLVDSAREALRNDDLFAARQYIGQAIALATPPPSSPTAPSP